MRPEATILTPDMREVEGETQPTRAQSELTKSLEKLFNSQNKIGDIYLKVIKDTKQHFNSISESGPVQGTEVQKVLIRG
jgi:hypothetical protein